MPLTRLALIIILINERIQLMHFEIIVNLLDIKQLTS